MTFHFFEAFLVGIAVTAIFGPISVIFVQQTLSCGVRGALAVGAGATLADVVFVLIAALGMSAANDISYKYSLFLKAAGSIVLLYLAYQEIRSALDLSKEVPISKDFFKTFLKVFFLTLSSPLTIASFVGIFATIGSTTVYESSVVGGGILLGAIVWWIILGSILLKIKHKISDKFMSYIKYASAFMLALFAILALVGF